MDQATNMETQLAEPTLQEPALAQSGSNVLRRHIKEKPKKAALARHRLWLASRMNIPCHIRRIRSGCTSGISIRPGMRTIWKSISSNIWTTLPCARSGHW